MLSISASSSTFHSHELTSPVDVLVKVISIGASPPFDEIEKLATGSGMITPPPEFPPDVSSPTSSTD